MSLQSPIYWAVSASVDPEVDYCKVVRTIIDGKRGHKHDRHISRSGGTTGEADQWSADGSEGHEFWLKKVRAK